MSDLGSKRARIGARAALRALMGWQGVRPNIDQLNSENKRIDDVLDMLMILVDELREEREQAEHEKQDAIAEELEGELAMDKQWGSG